MRYLLLLFCVLTLSSGGVEIQSDGRWSLEGISARWNMMTPDWHHTYGIKETIRKLDAARSVLEAKGKKVYFQTFAAPSSSGAIQVESRVYSDDFPDIGHSVPRLGTRPERRPTDIDRISPGINRSKSHLRISGRGQQFNLSLRIFQH